MHSWGKPDISTEPTDYYDAALDIDAQVALVKDSIAHLDILEHASLGYATRKGMFVVQMRFS